jgi:outer membrane immunogenic protein
MRRGRFCRAIALVAAAFGATGFVMPAPASAAPASDWSGFYIGANAGYGWGHRSAGFHANDQASAVQFGNFLPVIGGMPPGSPSFQRSGALAGAQFGYNWQFGPRWLAGLETDFDGVDLRGSGSSLSTPQGIPATVTVDERVKWLGTLRARLGYLPVENLLTYVTGGLAYGRVDHTGNYVTSAGTSVGSATFSFSCNAGETCFAGSSSKIATGSALGVGAEYAITKNITFKTEYMHVSLNKSSMTETALTVTPAFPTPSSITANFNRNNFNIARVGLNYRF